MKLAITTQGPELNSAVDLRFGRAHFFRIVDTETGQQTTVDNTSGVNAVEGAGTQAAETLARLGVQAVLTRHVGPMAWSALKATKIQGYAVDGVVRQRKPSKPSWPANCGRCPRRTCTDTGDESVD